MKNLITGAVFLMPIVFVLFIYWLSGNEFIRSNDLAGAVGIGVAIGFAAVVARYVAIDL